MLILSRRNGESLHIGDSIVVTVLSIQGKQVKLGITVPDDMVVLREEVYSRIKTENTQSLELDTKDFLTVAEIWNKTKLK